MNHLVTWADIDAELGKGEQMGYQTVLQFAKVGQMLIEKMGDTPIREFVQRAEQELPRLKQTTCHNYMTLAKNLSLLEQKQPDSQRAALAMIADAKRPPMPLPVPKPMQQQPTPAPSQDGDIFREVKSRMENVAWGFLQAHICKGEAVFDALQLYREEIGDEDAEDDAGFYAMLESKTGISAGEAEFCFGIYLEYGDLKGCSLKT